MAVAAPLSLTAIYEPVEDGWIQARVKELPGVITAAPTLEEARDLLGDAVREYLLAQFEEGDAGGPSGRSEPLSVTIAF
jgi:predicted RNase H-like HicB family nuclease